MAVKAVCEKNNMVANTKRTPYVTEAIDRLAAAITASEEATTLLEGRIESVCAVPPPCGTDKKAEPAQSVKLAEQLHILATRIERNTACIRDITDRVEL